MIEMLRRPNWEPGDIEYVHGHAVVVRPTAHPRPAFPWWSTDLPALINTSYRGAMPIAALLEQLKAPPRDYDVGPCRCGGVRAPQGVGVVCACSLEERFDLARSVRHPCLVQLGRTQYRVDGQLLREVLRDEFIPEELTRGTAVDILEVVGAKAIALRFSNDESSGELSWATIRLPVLG